VAVFGFALIFFGITSVEHRFRVSPAASGQVSWNASSDSNVSVPSRVSGVSYSFQAFLVFPMCPAFSAFLVLSLFLTFFVKACY